MHNGFGSGTRKREGEAKKDLRQREERSDGEETDTKPKRRVTTESLESHMGSARPFTRSSLGVLRNDHFEMIVSQFSFGRVGDGRREIGVFIFRFQFKEDDAKQTYMRPLYKYKNDEIFKIFLISSK